MSEGILFRRIFIKKKHSVEFVPLNYNSYILTHRQVAISVIIASSIIFFISYIFYKNISFSLICSIFGFLYLPSRSRQLADQRKKELNIQFKDLLYSLSSSLYAGKSLESCFREALNDLSIIYSDEDSLIIKETKNIIGRIEAGHTVESSVSDLAHRSRIDDIQSFADILNICKRTGGNMIEVVKLSTNIINEKIETMQEIETMLAEKRFEQKVLNIIPFAMMLLLSYGAKDYMSPVFTTIAGRVTVTISLILLATAFLISKQIMNFKV